MHFLQHTCIVCNDQSILASYRFLLRGSRADNLRR
jgi:hypothetical protein